ncbi:hypothetical protein HAX54_011219 [Datura stramonium]|uniref:UDP-N-acetylmuramate dehydrogenase n=1 Tax=Datura stramonium TaxID=4076 RepID=A0ABS8THL0_DATST|nr:hypothetical protein [Datura stramonium]
MFGATATAASTTSKNQLRTRPGYCLLEEATQRSQHMGHIGGPATITLFKSLAKPSLFRLSRVKFNLFDDMGFDGCVILNRIEFLEKIEPEVYRVGSGYPFNRLGVGSANEGLSGLEFAAGVPGTVGGATYECRSKWAEIITNEGESRMLKEEKLNFGYRLSPFQEMKDLASITAVTFRLKFSKTARERQQEYLARRWRTQPLGQRSAGSVFGIHLWMFLLPELIEKKWVERVESWWAVSNKHANFFINCSSATSQDMLELTGN